MSFVRLADMPELAPAGDPDKPRENKPLQIKELLTPESIGIEAQNIPKTPYLAETSSPTGQTPDK